LDRKVISPFWDLVNLRQYNIQACIRSSVAVQQRSMGWAKYVARNLTWLPKTPIEQAEETSCWPNQTAARRAGTLRMNTCDTATTVCPTKATANPSGEADATLIHEPPAVPSAPNMADMRSPCNGRRREYIGSVYFSIALLHLHLWPAPCICL
jgi:hypothetical protein